MNDQQYLLANAYVDGELTADERALAEADPDVMSEVELLLVLQTRLRKVDPPAASAREAALSAAIAAFPAAEPRPAPAINAAVKNTAVVPLRRRPAYARYLGLAAAVVAVGLLGAVVVTGLRSGDDDSATTDISSDAASEVFAEEAVEVPAAPSADRITESADAEMADEGDGQLDLDDSAAGSPAGALAAGDADAELPASEPADAELPASEPADEPASEPAEESADEPADDSGNFEQPLIDPTQPLTGAADLGAYGAYLLKLQAAGELPPTPNTQCPQPGLLAETRYVFDDLLVDVYIVVDDQNRTVSAIDPDTCEVLAIGPLF
jgi:hypothetical protein